MSKFYTARTFSRMFCWDYSSLQLANSVSKSINSTQTAKQRGAQHTKKILKNILAQKLSNNSSRTITKIWAATKKEIKPFFSNFFSRTSWTTKYFQQYEQHKKYISRIEPHTHFVPRTKSIHNKTEPDSTYIHQKQSESS